MRIASAGHAVFSGTMVAVGILGFVRGDFTAIWQGVPKAMPAREVLAYVCAVVCVACGIGVFWRHTAALAARALFAYLFLWLLIFKLRFIFLAPAEEVSYQSCGMTAVIVAGAWVLYAWFATDRDRQRFGFATGDKGIRIARVLFGLALIAFGLSHFAYLQLTAPLVPRWLPWHVGWAYFTGAAYLVAGAAVLSGVCAPLAAALATVQMGLFTLLIWVPMVASGHISAHHWAEFVSSWTLTAAAWVVADSYSGMPRVAAFKRLRRAPS